MTVGRHNNEPFAVDAPQLLRAGEAARALAISPRKLWALTASSEIPCVRIGRAVRYDAGDLRDWIEQQKVT